MQLPSHRQPHLNAESPLPGPSAAAPPAAAPPTTSPTPPSVDKKSHLRGITQEEGIARRGAMQALLNSILNPLRQHQPLYFDKQGLEKFNVDFILLDSISGDLPSGRQRFFDPIPPETVRQWIDEAKPFSDRPDEADFVNDPPGYEVGAASFLFGQCLYDYVVECVEESTPIVSSVTPDDARTSWVCIDNICPPLNYLSTRGWQAESVLRYKSDGTNYPTHPHQICFVADKSELKEGVLSASELNTVLWISAQYYNVSTRGEDVIPSVVISCSGWSVRLLQGVVSISNQSTEIRMSPILDFRAGIKDNYETFLTLLGWFVANPVNPNGH